MNIKEVATQTGINTHTLRTWQKNFNIEVPRNSAGYREYSEEIVKKLLAIKALREADNGINTIKNQLGIESLNINVVKPENIAPPANNENILNTLELMNQNINIKLEAVTDLAEKYSRACYEVGSLRAINESNIKDITGLQNENEKLRQNIETLNQEKAIIAGEHDQLRRAFEVEKLRPWYKRIFK